ncbi:MAG TPA: Ig-like domain-containing protein, partial [Gemmatimonadaceae bacterium]
AMPVWDIISALIGAPAVLPAFALAGSAVYGFSKVSKCNAAKAEVEAAIEKTYSTPEGMRPDVTLDAVHVTLDRSDTLHVGDTARLHAAALNRSGAEIRDRLFQWSSSDLVVAGVDGAGVLTAKSAGVADITAITGGVAGTRRLVVVP